MSDVRAKVASPAPSATEKAVAKKPKNVPVLRVYEMWGVLLGDPPGGIRAWSIEKSAWQYAKTFGLTPKRYRIIEMD